ncbi:MAG: PIN domain-containing protein [Terracidiphilus sp.]|nr:PIN domain-containing protein [Terracidiphilus sp.]
MTSFFPDVNVWLALSDGGHSHHAFASNWLDRLPDDSILILSRFTQMGLLCLLTNTAVMGDRTLTLGDAWAVYDGWLEDPRVDFYPEPRNVDVGFRRATEPFAGKAAAKWVGDCWLLAFAQAAHARLVTFDQGLCEFARKQGNRAVVPG